jgi:hypothetical protein
LRSRSLPALSRLAPTQSEPPFLVAQLIVMVIFVVLGIRAGIRFHPMAPRPAYSWNGSTRIGAHHDIFSPVLRWIHRDDDRT